MSFLEEMWVGRAVLSAEVHLTFALEPLHILSVVLRFLKIRLNQYLFFDNTFRHPGVRLESRECCKVRLPLFRTCNSILDDPAKGFLLPGLLVYFFWQNKQGRSAVCSVSTECEE